MPVERRDGAKLVSRALDATATHGTPLLLLAGALGGDSDEAERTVARVLVNSARPRSGSTWTRAELSRLVFLRYGQPVADPDVTLAVCVYGGLSWRQACDLLELPESVVADHLVHALRGVSEGAQQGEADRDSQPLPAGGLAVARAPDSHTTD